MRIVCIKTKNEISSAIIRKINVYFLEDECWTSLNLWLHIMVNRNTCENVQSSIESY